MYPPDVNINSDLRLRIISPDDPEHEKYLPEFRDYPFLNTTRRLTEDNNYGKDLPRSRVMSLGKSEADKKASKVRLNMNPKNVNLISGFSSDEERAKVKKGMSDECLCIYCTGTELSTETGTTDGAIKGWITRRAGGKGGIDGSDKLSPNEQEKPDIDPNEIQIIGDNDKRLEKMIDSMMKKEYNAYLKGKPLNDEARRIAYLDKKYDDVFSLQTSKVFHPRNATDLDSIFGANSILFPNDTSEDASGRYFSDVKKSDIAKLDPYQKALFNKMKRIHEAIESDDSIRKVGFPRSELTIETTRNYRLNLEKSYMYASAQKKERDVREFADRIGTEVITPLINSNVHLYYIQKDKTGEEDEKFFQERMSDRLDATYNELKYMNSKNIWTKELGRQMNLKLYAKKGHFKPSDFDLSDIESGDFHANAFWSRNGNSINIFDNHPRIPFRSPISQTLAHELTHSVYDARKHQADSDPAIKAQLDELTRIAENIDPKIVGKYLGSYAKGYVDIFRKEGRKGWGINLETELLSAITDKINPRYGWIFRQARGKTYTIATMKKHMPELMKVYEKLFGEEHKWEEDPPLTRLKRSDPKDEDDEETLSYFPRDGYDDSTESVGIEYDVQFLDYNRDIVPKEEATQVIRKGYQNNELIIFEHLEKSENADEVGGQVAKSEIIGSDTVKYGKLDPKKYLNDISWSN